MPKLLTASFVWKADFVFWPKITVKIWVLRGFEALESVIESNVHSAYWFLNKKKSKPAGTPIIDKLCDESNEENK